MEVDNEFMRAVQFVLEQECRKGKDGKLDDGYVNNPNDPGGETKYGISKRAYPNVDIKGLTLDGALDIYRHDYWPVASGIPFPLNVCVFDCAVNQGTKTARNFLQVCRGDYKLFIQQRREHYLALYAGKFATNPNRDAFKSAWLGRLNNLEKFIEVQQAG